MKNSPLSIALCVFLLAACGDGDNGGNGNGGRLQDDGPLFCPTEEYVTGRGNVWRGHDPYDLEERDLPCLNGDGYLGGYYTGTIDPEPGEATYSDDNQFLYEINDNRINEVQAYYVFTHMANWLIGYFEPTEEFDNTIQLLRSDRVNLEYNRDEVQSQQECGSMHMGMQGLSSTVLNVDVFAHEFGHHIVFSLNKGIVSGMIHEALADYLAASFTQNSVIEPSEWSGFDRDLENDHRAPDDVITRGEYCALLLGRMEADGVDEVYPDLANTLRQCQYPQVPEHHWAGMILGAALWELRKQIGEDNFQPVLFRALHRYDINDTGHLMDRLIEEDLAFHQGKHESLIRDAFASRGIDQDLGLDFEPIPWVSTCNP